MTIEYVAGNLFNLLPQTEGINVIAHVCNDIGGWGSGFVLPLAKAFPQAEKAYRKWYEDGMTGDVRRINTMQPGTPFKLGEFQLVHCGEGTIVDFMVRRNGDQRGISVVVANMIAQRSTITRKPNSTPLKYWALAKCLSELGDFWCRQKEVAPIEVNLCCPKFGSALAGGSWDIIETLIEECWVDRGLPVTIYEYPEADREYLIVAYTRLLHKYRDVGNPHVAAFREAHQNDKLFAQRAEMVDNMGFHHEF